MGSVVRESARYVCSQSRHVTVVGEGISRVVAGLTDEELRKLSSPASFDAGDQQHQTRSALDQNLVQIPAKLCAIDLHFVDETSEALTVQSSAQTHDHANVQMFTLHGIEMRHVVEGSSSGNNLALGKLPFAKQHSLAAKFNASHALVPGRLQYLLVVDALNFCFWPDPELEYAQLSLGIKVRIDSTWRFCSWPETSGSETGSTRPCHAIFAFALGREHRQHHKTASSNCLNFPHVPPVHGPESLAARPPGARFLQAGCCKRRGCEGFAGLEAGPAAAGGAGTAAQGGRTCNHEHASVPDSLLGLGLHEPEMYSGVCVAHIHAPEIHSWDSESGPWMSLSPRQQ
eukprot:927260-Pelagomonas_calceolata.AAC.2